MLTRQVTYTLFRRPVLFVYKGNDESLRLVLSSRLFYSSINLYFLDSPKKKKKSLNLFSINRDGRKTTVLSLMSRKSITFVIVESVNIKLRLAIVLPSKINWWLSESLTT